VTGIFWESSAAAITTAALASTGSQSVWLSVRGRRLHWQPSAELNTLTILFEQKKPVFSSISQQSGTDTLAET
jgi:hypothetical protein